MTTTLLDQPLIDLTQDHEALVPLLEEICQTPHLAVGKTLQAEDSHMLVVGLILQVRLVPTSRTTTRVEFVLHQDTPNVTITHDPLDA